MHHGHRYLGTVHQCEWRGSGLAGIKPRAPLAFEINDIRNDRNHGSVIAGRQDAADQAIGRGADPAVHIVGRACQVAHGGAVIRLIHLGKRSGQRIRIQMHPQRIGNGQVDQGVWIQQRSLQRGVIVVQILCAQRAELQRLCHALLGRASGTVVDDLQRHGDADRRDRHIAGGAGIQILEQIHTEGVVGRDDRRIDGCVVLLSLHHRGWRRCARTARRSRRRRTRRHRASIHGPTAAAAHGAGQHKSECDAEVAQRIVLSPRIVLSHPISPRETPAFRPEGDSDTRNLACPPRCAFLDVCQGVME